jgi:hypothetical protein
MPDTPGPRGEAAWQAERRRIADRNADVSKRGKRDRQEHERRVNSARSAARDPDAPRQSAP